MPRVFYLFLPLAFVFAALASAASADAPHGEQIANRWCASCRVVARDQVGATTQAPPFSEIAKIEGFDAAKVALFLLAPHPRMPDMNLSRSEAADLAAYIGMQGR
jgi:mono/diheme cytochrome c family protein